MPVPLHQAKAEFFRMPGHPVHIQILELMQAARRIPTEVLAGQNQLLAELREAEKEADREADRETDRATGREAEVASAWAS